MTTLRTAAQQALEALEAGPNVDPIFAGETEDALRAALAEPVVLRTPEECIDILLQRMSVSDLAHAIGVDPSAISHAKAGRARITHYAAVDKLRSLV